MTEVHIDLETKSKVDLRRTGVYRYAEDASTDVWCMAYAVNEESVGLWEPSKPAPFIDDGCTTFIAHNANFERTIWRHVLTPRYGWPECPPIERWRCTMAAALAMSLPASLKNATRAVGIETGGKVDEGHRLMLQMCKPRKARKGEEAKGWTGRKCPACNGYGEVEADGRLTCPDCAGTGEEYGEITHWFDDEARRQRLYAVCMKDVEDERELHRRILALRPGEQKLWELDQRINDRGVFVDIDLCEAALDVVNMATEWLDDEMREITDGAVSATTNVGQISAWLRLQGVDTESLDKAAIDDLLMREDLSVSVRRVLEIRREAAKAAVKKIDALIAGRSADGRARGLLQYHAASTGRWAGRRFQPQNIKRPELKNVDEAIATVATGNADIVRLSYGNPLAVVGDCLRGMVVASPGKKIIAADFSNIEGRVLAWLAGEGWKLDAFRAQDNGTGPEIYKLTASRILSLIRGVIVTPEEITWERQGYGKVPELALGFQGGVGAFQKMAINYGVRVTDAEAEQIKVSWRDAHPATQQFWDELDDAGQFAVRNRGKACDIQISGLLRGSLVFKCVGSFLFVRLPSGRALSYPYPCIKPKETPWGEMRDAVSYKGVDSYTRKWTDCYAYGGLWAENVTQAVARDVMAEAMLRLEARGYPVVLTVHDEIVSEVENATGPNPAEFERIVCELPPWAAGLPVTAQAWEGQRYRK